MFDVDLNVVFVLVLVVCMFAAFVWEKVPPDVVALSAVAVLLAMGILHTRDFLAVFSNSAPITIAMMFILSAALERTGCLNMIGDVIGRVAGTSYARAMLVMMPLVVVASAFMNNTPIVIVMTPIIISLGRSMGVLPSRMLMPLSFAAIFGGTTTLIGTSTNILVGGIAIDHGLPPIGVFEMTPVGLIFAGAGIVYMMLAGRFLLPDRYSLSSLLDAQPKRRFLAELLILEDSAHVGKNVNATKLASPRTRVMDVIRRGLSLRAKLDSVILEAGDRIVIKTEVGEVLGLKENGQVDFHQVGDNLQPVSGTETVVMEGSVSNRSSLIGKRVGSLYLRRKYGVYIMAIHRDNANIRQNFENITLRFGDTLLFEGPAENIARLMEDGDLVNLTQPLERPIRAGKAPIAIATIAAVMGLAAFGVMPIAGLALIGAVVVMLTGCVDADEAFAAIDWRILFLIFGMLGLSTAMEQTGAAALVVETAVSLVQGLGPVAILAIVYVLTSILTEMVSNNAVAVLLAPIAIALADQLGLDSRPFLLAVMFAASASFATPIGYQTNTFVYGAGGYKFRDFLKVGLPLNVLFAFLATLLLPIFFPF